MKKFICKRAIIKEVKTTQVPVCINIFAIIYSGPNSPDP